jgi:hypothetical protein
VKWAVKDLERDFPWIPWREPIPISTVGRGHGLGCRVCIASKGIRGAEVEFLPQTPKEFAEHWERWHQDSVTSPRDAGGVDNLEGAPPANLGKVEM